MTTKQLSTLLACPLLLMLAGCDSAPTTSVKEAPKPVEAIGGQSALFKMYQVARAAWAKDVQVLSLNSMHVEGVPPLPAKAGAWQAVFTSDTLGKKRSYTYSVVESLGENLHKDVFAGPEESWSGKSGVQSEFLIAAVSIDTPAALKTALENGGSDYDKKNPNMNIAFVLEKTPKFPDPAWRVIWGESAGTSNFSIYVDASTGTFLTKMH
jgi:hypothetical protein